MPSKQTLEQKREEQARLSKAYTKHQREQWQELCAAEPRLPEFKSFLRKQERPAALLVSLSDHWLRFASDDVRFAALRLLDKHANRLSGKRVLDDPLPPERSFFFAAKELLAVR